MANVTAAAAHTQEECLRDAICVIDGLAQEGFSQIAAIASLALLSMEVPDAFHLRTDLAYALSAIRGKAQEIEDCIHSEAERVGCNYVDEHHGRRLKAQVEESRRIRGGARRAA